jgi:hypothetical protein
MRYRTVCWVVPVEDEPQDDAQQWAQRAWRSEHMLDALHAAAVVAGDAEPVPGPGDPKPPADD